MSDPIGKFYYEAAVAQKLLLARDTVRYIRTDILKKEQWRQDGRVIVLSSDGLLAFIKHVGEELLGNAQLTEADFAECIVGAQKKEAVKLTVRRLCPNRKLLYATLPGVDGAPDREVTVRVTDNRNFRQKMSLKARAPAPGSTGAAAFYQLEGRCPRFPGRY